MTYAQVGVIAIRMKVEKAHGTPRVPDADAISRFRDSPAVWLTFAGSAVYELYSSLLEPIGLKPSWVTAMAIIEQRPNITQSGLGRELRINRASSMATCARMEETGLVIRTALKGRNQTGLNLSENGRKKLDDACNIEREMIEKLLEGIPSINRNSLIEMLRLITNRSAIAV